jgi:hypothetical protein
MSEELHEFDPDWTIAPAAMLRDWMNEHGMTPGLLALWCGSGEVQAEADRLIGEVLDRKPLTDSHARMLELGTLISADMWLGFERRYRDDLAAGRIDTTPED